MIRAHKIRLNPTPEQASYFWRASGTARFVYNWALARWKQKRAAGLRTSFAELKKEFNAIKGQQFPWVYEVTKCAAEQEFANLAQAFRNYFDKKRRGQLPKPNKPRKDGEERGFPRFKSKKRDTPSFYLANDKFSLNGQWITASSQLCHVCGYKNDDLTLHDRAWTCPACRRWHDRDVNAAHNIHQEAQRLLMASR
jgi:transposase